MTKAIKVIKAKSYKKQSTKVVKLIVDKTN